jgi:hypothetical protein
VTALIAAAVTVQSTAQADMTSSTTLSLTPGSSASVGVLANDGNGTGHAAFRIPRLPDQDGLYLGLRSRVTAAGAYLARVRVYSDGALTVGMSKIVNSTEQRLGDVPITGVRAAAGSTMELDIRTEGRTSVALAARAWLAGSSRPSWQFSLADSSADRITHNGTFCPWAYLSSGATAGMSVPVSGITWISTSTTPTPTSTTSTSTTSTSAPSSTTPSSTTPSSTTTTSTRTTTPTPQPPSPGTEPNASNTGVPAGTKLTVHQGDLTITTPGATYDALDVHGFVVVKAPDVTIRRSIIRGGTVKLTPGGNRGVLTANSAAVRNLVVEDTEIVPTYVSPQVDGVSGGNFTLRRVEVNGGVDTVKVYKDDVVIDSCWLHGTVLQTDPYTGKKTHNDGVQVQAGHTITVRNTRIEGADNTAIMVTQNAGPTLGLVIEHNWLDGGGCSVNIVPDHLDAIGPIYLTGNRFGHHQRVADCAVVQTHSTTLVASQNVWVDSNSPAKINIWN